MCWVMTFCHAWLLSLDSSKLGVKNSTPFDKMRHLFFRLTFSYICIFWGWLLCTLIILHYLMNILSFSRVVSFSSSSLGTFDSNLSPRYTWSEHALPVTDIHCGHSGMRGHVITSSLDQTCKVHMTKLWKNGLKPFKMLINMRRQMYCSTKLILKGSRACHVFQLTICLLCPDLCRDQNHVSQA